LEVYLYAIDEAEARVVMFPSAKYPHLFKVGFFRSEHDRKGFNSHLKKMCGETLMSIFEVPKDTTSLAKAGAPQPSINWLRAKERAKEVKRKYDEWVGGTDEKNFYQQALEIIEETIDYVLARAGDGKDYRLSWIEVSKFEDEFTKKWG